MNSDAKPDANKKKRDMKSDANRDKRDTNPDANRDILDTNPDAEGQIIDMKPDGTRANKDTNTDASSLNGDMNPDAEPVNVTKPTSKQKKKRQTGRKKAGKSKALAKRAQPPRISPEQYNAMYQAYKEKQSVSHVSKTCKVTYETAEHYINGKAKPDYAMEQIKERYLRAEKAKHTEEDRTDIQRAKERLRLVDAVINLAGGEAMIYQHDLKNRIAHYEEQVIEWQNKPPATRGEPPEAPRAISLGALGKLLDRMVRTEQYLRGGVDKVLGVIDAGNRFSRYSDDELLELAYTGRVPDHDRSANNLEKKQD